MSEDRLLGPWRIRTELGHGGNGTVWEAEHADSGDTGALKEIRSRNVDREPYRRFLTEINTLQRLGSFPGVLPLIDSHIPEKPQRTDKPWLVMPIAASLATSLQDRGYDSLVGAVAAIAETLAALKADHGIAHRDIKPANLYELKGAALIGDFGLVALPDPSGLTKEGKPLGPANFIPFEMLNDAANADPFASDVFSLAKSFWALSTGLTFPPPGHQPADAAPYRIADFRPHPQAARLDQLVDRATRLNPRERPSAAAFAEELRTWLELPAAESELQLTELSSAVRESLASEIDESQRIDQWKDDAHGAARRLEELSRPLDAAMKEADPRAEIAVVDDLVHKRLRTLEHLGSPEVLFHFTRASKIATGPPPIQKVLRVGRGVELTESGDLIVRAMVDLGLDGVMQTDMEWVSEERIVPVGSIQQEAALQATISELAENLSEALSLLVEQSRSRD